jgi:hypothetical protein
MPRWLPQVLARIHRLAAEGKVRFTDKGRLELEALKLGLDEHDATDVLLGLATAEFGGRVFSSETDEWMYVFKPRIGGIPLYIKVVFRAAAAHSADVEHADR